jgi:hypothetical protein
MKENYIAKNTNIRLNNVNPNGENVVANNLNHANFSFFWNMSKLTSKTSVICYFFKGCHNCPQNKTPHIVHFTYKHWINQNFSCRYGCVLSNKKKIILFLMFFGSCPNYPKFKKNNQGSITFFLQLQIDFNFFQRYYIVLPSSKISKTHSCFWSLESLLKLPKNPLWNFGPLGIKLKLQQLINTIELVINLIFCRVFVYVMFFKLPFDNR